MYAVQLQGRSSRSKYRDSTLHLFLSEPFCFPTRLSEDAHRAKMNVTHSMAIFSLSSKVLMSS